MTGFVVFLAVGLVAFIAQAEVIEVEGKVTSVDAEARIISIERKTATGQKQLKLEVNKKAGDLSGIREGDTVALSYDPALEIVTTVRRSATEPNSSDVPKGATEFLYLEELNGPESDNEHCVSSDGTEIVWTKGLGPDASVWHALRRDADALFSDKKKIFKGRAAVFSEDGLQIFFYSPDMNGIATASRKSREAEFGRPRPVKTLAFPTAALPRWMSSDGLTLYVDQVLDEKANKYSLFQIDRETPESEWEQRTVVRSNFKGIPEGFRPIYATGTPDPLQLLCGAPFPEKGPRIGVLTRNERKAAFNKFTEIPIKDFKGAYPFVVRPQYVPATKELFLVAKDPIAGPRSDQANADIYVIKDFELPAVK